MKVYAVSDLHLSINNPKPMDIFGPTWNDYLDKIIDSWNSKVLSDDIVLICGDISWAMTLDEAKADLDLIASLSGKKIIIRGNHDYWWKTISNVRKSLKGEFFALQNDSLRIGDFVFCGTRGWTIDNQTEEDKKIYERELIRLKLSLDSMQKIRKQGDKAIVLTHYPPLERFSDLINEYNIDKAVYGHLHGKNLKVNKRYYKNNTEYILSSCDQINNELIEII